MLRSQPGSRQRQRIPCHFELQCRTTCSLSAVFSLHRPSDAPPAKDGLACNRHPFPTLKILSCGLGETALKASPSLSLNLIGMASATGVKRSTVINAREDAMENLDTPPRFPGRKFQVLSNVLRWLCELACPNVTVYSDPVPNSDHFCILAGIPRASAEPLSRNGKIIYCSV